MLKTIKNDIFTDTSIRSLYIPKFLKPHLFYINDEYVVQIIEIDENYNVDLNNLYVFFEFYNALVMIPSSLNNYDFSNYPIDDYLGINKNNIHNLHISYFGKYNIKLFFLFFFFFFLFFFCKFINGNKPMTTR